MWDRIKNVSQKICDVLELVLALMVGIAVFMTIVQFVPELAVFIRNGANPNEFLVFLEELFSIVIGVEFLKMLCKPSADNVIEVIVFLVARHMIIGSHSAVDNLLSIAGIAALYLISYVLKRHRKESNGKDKE